MLRNILLSVGVFSAIFAMLIFSGRIPVGNRAQTPQGEVVIWGTLPDDRMENIIQAFNPQAKTYRVSYKQIKEDVFTQTLVEALANGVGPDLILAPYQIILSQAARIYPFPASSMGEKQFKDTFVDGAAILYGPNGALALPVSVEPMVLFYNRTLFSKHGVVNPPTYWDEVTSITPSLTIAKNGVFAESGIALGAENTPNAKDILMTMVAQLGQTPVTTQYDQLGQPFFNVTANTPVTEGGEVLPLSSVVRFFTQFADTAQKAYSWNRYAGNPDDMFVAERLAMYVGYSGELGTLRARNPRGEFEMSYLPQVRGYNNFATGMRLYGLATLKKTRNPTAALTVQAQFSGGDISQKIAVITGGVPALRAYSGTQGLHEVLARSMLVARGWNDIYYIQSASYVSALLSDVLNYRYGVADAVSIFIGRLTDLYTQR
jgi:ABC-type glycerol-3-phosphate transport system substrate-binding protein